MGSETRFEGKIEIEMDVVDADGATDLRIDQAQVAVLVVRQRLFLRLFGQNMRHVVRKSTLLDEQQGEDEDSGSKGRNDLMTASP